MRQKNTYAFNAKKTLYQGTVSLYLCAFKGDFEIAQTAPRLFSRPPKSLEKRENRLQAEKECDLIGWSITSHMRSQCCQKRQWVAGGARPPACWMCDCRIINTFPSLPSRHLPQGFETLPVENRIPHGFGFFQVPDFTLFRTPQPSGFAHCAVYDLQLLFTKETVPSPLTRLFVASFWAGVC